MRYQVKWHPNKWSKINERLHAFANCKSPASIAGGLERNSVRCAQQKISSRFVPPSTMRSTMTSAQPFTVSLHDGQLPRADAVAHAGRLVPRQGQHRHGSPQCEQPRTPCLSLRARAPGHHRFANGSGTDHPCCGADALPRSPALKTRRCAARVGERFLAVRLPGPQIQDKAADVSEPRQLFAQGQAQAPTRRSTWLGTLPVVGAGLASLRRLHSLPHPLYRLRRSLPLIPPDSNLTRPARPRRWSSSRGSNRRGTSGSR